MFPKHVHTVTLWISGSLSVFIMFCNNDFGKWSEREFTKYLGLRCFQETWHRRVLSSVNEVTTHADNTEEALALLAHIVRKALEVPRQRFVRAIFDAAQSTCKAQYYRKWE